MDLRLGWQLEFGDTSQILVQDFGFDPQLLLIRGVLVVASAATLEVWARRINTQGRGFQDALRLGSRKSRFLFRDGRFNLLASEYEGNKYGFSPAVLVGGETGKTVAAIDQFFDGETHEVSSLGKLRKKALTAKLTK